MDVIIMSIHYWFNFLHGKTVGVNKSSVDWGRLNSDPKIGIGTEIRAIVPPICEYFSHTN